MGNLFISILITIFFLRKSSKEVDDKTKNASWARTCIYLILTIIFGIFYYKTFQVATIVNKVEITSLRGHEDSLLHSTDTIECLNIYNNFKTLGSYKNPYFDIVTDDEAYSTEGGVDFTFAAAETSKYMLKDKWAFSDSIRRSIEEITGKTIDDNTGAIYKLHFFSTSVPSLIPVFPIMRFDEPETLCDKNGLFSIINNIGNIAMSGNGKVLIAKSEPKEGYFIDALLCEQIKIAHYKQFPPANMAIPHPLANSINVFTACDLSQYTYCLEFKSDIHIKNLSVVYNVPIEVVNHFDGMISHANAFTINDSELLESVNGKESAMVLIKLPSMANLQQIRSLILTAIITALFSLFCTNLFYRFRKKVVDYLKKHSINISEENNLWNKKVEDIKFLLYTIAFTILVMFLIITFMAVAGYSFLIEDTDILEIIVKGILFVVIIAGSLFYIRKCYINDFKKEKDKKDK